MDITKKEIDTRYREKHKSEIKTYRKSYYYKNKEALNKKSNLWYKQNQNKVKNYKETNKEKIKKKQKSYYKEYYKRNKKQLLQKNLNYVKNRRKHDTVFNLRYIMRRRIQKILFSNKKSLPTEKFIGCTSKKLKEYLEAQFKPGMTWKNHGQYGWHIDHIKPCSLFNRSNIKEQQKCFHYTNLQPLWWYENLEKGDKY